MSDMTKNSKVKEPRGASPLENLGKCEGAKEIVLRDCDVRVRHRSIWQLNEEARIWKMIYKSRRSYVKVENVGEWNGVEEQVEGILENFRREYRAKCFCVGYAEHLKKCQGN